jgi:hypothetical protein
MKPTEKPLFADIRKELVALGRELRAMATARWELARLEVTADLRSAKRLAIVWFVVAVMLLTAIPVLVVGLADALGGYGNLSRGGWLLLFAGGLLTLGGGGGYLAWRGFRRRFVGLQETLEELREDLVWLREKAKGGEE